MATLHLLLAWRKHLKWKRLPSLRLAVPFSCLNFAVSVIIYDIGSVFRAVSSFPTLPALSQLMWSMSMLEDYFFFNMNPEMLGI